MAMAVEGTHDGSLAVEGFISEGIHQMGSERLRDESRICWILQAMLLHWGAYPSDHRWKNNIKPIQSALEKIMDLNKII